MKRNALAVLVASTLALATSIPLLAEPGHNPNERLDVLEAALAKMVTQNVMQQAQLARVQADLASANAKLAALQSALATVQANPVLAMGPYVSVRTDTLNLVKGPHIIFEGVNVHIRDGAGERSLDSPESWGGDLRGSPSGLGNLIIGYNELTNSGATTVRGGSHCLVVGPGNSYTCNWGVVLGYDNSVTAVGAGVLGGQHNVASGPASAISGGCANRTDSGAWHESISGGANNLVTGPYAWAASITGGYENKVTSSASTISGGWQNIVGDGFVSSISGGWQNTTTGATAASISGGRSNLASGSESSVAGGEGNTAVGYTSSVSGGANRTATTDSSWVAGGLSQPN